MFVSKISFDPVWYNKTNHTVNVSFCRMLLFWWHDKAGEKSKKLVPLNVIEISAVGHSKYFMVYVTDTKIRHLDIDKQTMNTS